MDAAFQAAHAQGWPPDALHREYFSAPAAAARSNKPFVLVLARSGRELAVAADERATDALAAAGLAAQVKCSDGLCGVCAVGYDAAASDEIEHRDFVLCTRERRARVILCCSRPMADGGRLVIDL
jgi:ferredoxin